jgi:hypothetical protein
MLAAYFNEPPKIAQMKPHPPEEMANRESAKISHVPSDLKQRMRYICNLLPTAPPSNPGTPIGYSE